MASKHHPRNSFLTWNIYQGFDSAPLFVAPPEQIPAVVTELFRLFLATNFPVRAQAIAESIAARKPDLIGLQEAVKVELVIPTFGTVTYDFIELVVEALDRQGLEYKVAARNHDAEAELPDSNGNRVRFLDRDAILVRKDRDLDVVHKQEANFQTNLVVFLAGQPFTVLRGWSSIDVRIDGQVVRVINTHLDSFVEAIRDAQAAEIIQGPANTHLPVVITGDLNATPNSSTLLLFRNAGFEDTWDKVGIGPGFSSEQSADLLNAASLLHRRIDYVLFKNGWDPIEAELVGESQQDRTRTGLWPSDHAGVSASLQVEDHRGHHDDCD